MKTVLFSLIAIAALFLVGCYEMRQIPAGFIGKILTPQGWQDGLYEAGSIDLKEENSDGTFNVLVIMEATSLAIKEGFGQTSQDNKDAEDHRILIGNAPVTVDVYVRCMVPTDEKRRSAIFAMITPQNHDDARLKSININMIYERFAKMDVRSSIRGILQKEQSLSTVTSNLDKYNAILFKEVVSIFERNGVPLQVQNVTISNMKQDATVWAAENQKTAALSQVEAINKIGEALRNNPQYVQFKKYETYEKISGKIGTFTIIEGQPGGIVVGK